MDEEGETAEMMLAELSSSLDRLRSEQDFHRLQWIQEWSNFPGDCAASMPKRFMWAYSLQIDDFLRGIHAKDAGGYISKAPTGTECLLSDGSRPDAGRRALSRETSAKSSSGRSSSSSAIFTGSTSTRTTSVTGASRATSARSEGTCARMRSTWSRRSSGNTREGDEW